LILRFCLVLSTEGRPSPLTRRSLTRPSRVFPLGPANADGLFHRQSPTLMRSSRRILLPVSPARSISHRLRYTCPAGILAQACCPKTRASSLCECRRRFVIDERSCRRTVGGAGKTISLRLLSRGCFDTAVRIADNVAGGSIATSCYIDRAGRTHIRSRLLPGL